MDPVTGFIRFLRESTEPATTDNCIRSPVHCIGFLPFSDEVHARYCKFPAKYCTFPCDFHGKCMGILLPGNIDLGNMDDIQGRKKNGRPPCHQKYIQWLLKLSDHLENKFVLLISWRRKQLEICNFYYVVVHCL